MDVAVGASFEEKKYTRHDAMDRKRSEGEGPFIYPYNLGWCQNLQQVFTWSGIPRSDGYVWELVKGCNQFTLTEEQLKQKAEKRDRTVLYSIVDSYSGALFPCSKGLQVSCCIPCTDEARIILHKGDKVQVTRWKKHWLYGKKVLSDEKTSGKDRIRGWFPHKCAKEVTEDADATGDKKKV